MTDNTMTDNTMTDNTMTKRKGTNNELLNTIQKTKYRATPTPLKTGRECRWSGKVSNSCSTRVTRRVILVTHPVCTKRWFVLHERIFHSNIASNANIINQFLEKNTNDSRVIEDLLRRRH